MKITTDDVLKLLADGPLTSKQVSEGLGAGATTASTTQAKTLTLAHLERTAQMLRDMPPDPIGDWMRAQGRPPEQWRVVLPKAIREAVEGPIAWPDYVAFSDVLDWPVFLPRRWAWLDLTPDKQPK